MAHRSVQLYLCADPPGTGWRYCRAVFRVNHKPKPHMLLRPDGIEESPSRSGLLPWLSRRRPQGVGKRRKQPAGRNQGA